MTTATDTKTLLNRMAAWIKSYSLDASRFYGTADDLAEMLYSLKIANSELYARAIERALSYLTIAHQADVVNRIAVAEEEAGMFGVWCRLKD